LQIPELVGSQPAPFGRVQGLLHAAFRIEVLAPLPPPPPPDDTNVAAAIRRVATFMRTSMLDPGPPPREDQPPFVSRVPNELPKPVKPGDFGLAAADAAYSMAPFMIPPGQALVVTGRWPEDCRSANVCIWNRHMQTLDYLHRPVTLNRRQTRTDDEGRFRIVVAHEDPGVPNWLDTEGRPFGLLFLRDMLPEGEIEQPQAESMGKQQLILVFAGLFNCRTN